MTRAHPRSRGEHSLSPPLCFRLAGLIPARAGNTETERPKQPRRRAHPRSRGEHMRIIYAAFPVVGSSPLARGTLDSRSAWPGGAGLIPARAGNTFPIAQCGGRGRAHPRSRGEHLACGSVRKAGGGSSPLARGTRAGGAVRATRPGLIPARAGNTEQLRQERRVFGAHPRSRGEHGG